MRALELVCAMMLLLGSSLTGWGIAVAASSNFLAFTRCSYASLAFLFAVLRHRGVWVIMSIDSSNCLRYDDCASSQGLYTGEVWVPDYLGRLLQFSFYTSSR